MDKNKSDVNNQNSRSMLDQKRGSMLDKKTNEDFNNEHPDHDDSGVINDSSISDEKNVVRENKQTIKK